MRSGGERDGEKKKREMGKRDDTVLRGVRATPPVSVGSRGEEGSRGFQSGEESIVFAEESRGLIVYREKF